MNVLVMIDIATGFSIEPPTAWSTRNATSSSTLGARLHSSDATENTRQAGDEGALAPEPVRRRAGEHQQARHHDRVGVDRPLQPRDAGVQLRPIDGSATFTAVMSSPTMKRLSSR